MNEFISLLEEGKGKEGKERESKGKEKGRGKRKRREEMIKGERKVERKGRGKGCGKGGERGYNCLDGDLHSLYRPVCVFLVTVLHGHIKTVGS